MSFPYIFHTRRQCFLFLCLITIFTIPPALLLHYSELCLFCLCCRSMQHAAFPLCDMFIQCVTKESLLYGGLMDSILLLLCLYMAAGCQCTFLLWRTAIPSDWQCVMCAGAEEYTPMFSWNGVSTYALSQLAKWLGALPLRKRHKLRQQLRNVFLSCRWKVGLQCPGM